MIPHGPLKRAVKRHRRERMERSDAAFAARRKATAQPEQPHVYVSMPIAEARHLSLGCADLLCWCAGFNAARPDGDNNPLGTYQVRDLRDHLQRAIDKADPRRVTDQIPF